jgi:hypothetical protein
MATLTVQLLVDTFLRASPMRPSSIQWRLGFIGGGAGSLTMLLLAVFAILAIAVAADDRPVGYVVAIVSVVGAVFCILALGVFALDALQVKRQVLASVTSTYNAATIWVAVKLLFAAVVFMVLGVAAFRAMRSSQREAAQPTAKARASMLVGTPRASGVAAPTQTGGIDR